MPNEIRINEKIRMKLAEFEENQAYGKITLTYKAGVITCINYEISELIRAEDEKKCEKLKKCIDI